jgi:hypothetical protein
MFMFKPLSSPLLPILFCLLLTASCTSDPQDQEDHTGTGGFPDIGIPLPPADVACLRSRLVICEPGLSFALLGQSMEELQLPNPETIEVMDSVVRAGGYYWNSKTLRTTEGVIVLEGDFIDDRQEGLETRPEYNRIFRIRIETPDLRTANDIGIGNNLGDLKNTIGEADLQALYLPDFKAIDISTPHSRIHYLLRDENGQFSDLRQPATLPLEEIPDGIPIYALVLIRDF